MPKIFEKVGLTKPKYSAFDLSHEKKLSCDMGQLIPILCQDVVPGDYFQMQTEVMIRLAPQLAPPMHRVNAYVHYFFVPNRILWSSWEDFITGGQEGESTATPPTLPLNPGGAASAEGSLGDYLGLPEVTAGGGVHAADVSQLPFRAYHQIWNDYYRDETLQDPSDITDTVDLVQLKNRCWEKDYYTSALPWTQRGPEVGTPITFDNTVPSRVRYTDDQSGLLTTENIEGSNVPEGYVTGTDGANQTALNVDNSESLNITINDLRTASALQRWLEKQARGGYRYIETVLSHFGIRSSDQRLQRAEYIGGGRQPVVFSEVLNTSATTSDAQGTMAGHGISVGTANRGKKRFEEHGYVMGILSVMPRTNYQQGVHRHWLRFDKEDYYWPEFANIGEQAVMKKEIYYDKGDTEAEQDAAFGYQQRYAEYKYGCSTVHGEFKSSLDFWHMGRIFGSAPELNSAFVQANPTKRIFAVTEGNQLWCQVYNSIKARRPMPYFSNPSLR